VDSDKADVISASKLFHICGPTTGKARLATVDSLAGSNVTLINVIYSRL